MPCGPPLYGILWGHMFLQIWGVGVVRIIFHIYIYMPITSFDGPLLGFTKSRSRGKDEKIRQEKAEMKRKTKH